MKFERFKYLVSGLKACYDKMDKYYNVLKIDEVWDDFNKMITFLLEEVYQPQAIEYILDEWLRGNKEPIRYKLEDGTELEKPVSTLRQLWSVMETYRLDSDSKAPEVKEIKEDIDWDMFDANEE